MEEDRSPLRKALDNLDISKTSLYTRPAYIQRCTDRVVERADKLECAVAAFLGAMDAFWRSSARDARPEPVLMALYTVMGRELPSGEEKDG